MKIRKIKKDVVVVGGGISGTVAAVAAARGGASVLLIEKNGCLGGTATVGMLGEINGYSFGGHKIVGGIPAEIIERLIAQGHGLHQCNIPMSSNPAIVLDRVRYHSEYLKILLDEIATEAGVKVLFHCNFSDVCLDKNNAVTGVTVKTQFEKLSISCPIVIDATGNAEVAYKANAPTIKAPTSDLQAITLLFKMSGIKRSRYETMTIDELRQIMLQGYERNILPTKILSICLIPGTNDAVLNMTRALQIDHESLEDLSRAQMETRQQIKRCVTFIKKQVPGFEDAYLSVIAPQLGIRDARRIIGRYTLSGDDVRDGRTFEDAIAVGCYPLDIHRKNSVDFQNIKGRGVYDIPFSCLIPQKIRGLIACGNCISASNEAFAAIRIMSNAMTIGEAAGTASALATLYKQMPHRLKVKELQSVLKANGSVITWEFPAAK